MFVLIAITFTKTAQTPVENKKWLRILFSQIFDSGSGSEKIQNPARGRLRICGQLRLFLRQWRIFSPADRKRKLTCECWRLARSFPCLAKATLLAKNKRFIERLNSDILIAEDRRHNAKSPHILATPSVRVTTHNTHAQQVFGARPMMITVSNPLQ